MRRPGPRFPLLFLLLLPLLFLSTAGRGASLPAPLPYPVIGTLRLEDPLFRQLTADISAARRAEAAGDPMPPLLLFAYETRQDEDLFSVSARCSLPYDTLATLNRLESAELTPGTLLLIPNRYGLFLPKPPESDLEILAFSALQSGAGGDAGGAPEPEVEPVRITYPDGKRREALFFPGVRFSSLQRAYFLGILFRLPLDRSVLTSAFGMRRDPFTGGHTFHRGIDLAAPEGSPVYAVRSGVVSSRGNDAVLGNFVVIDHDGGYKTVYGHLKSIDVQLKSAVRLGMIIGSVGNTGLSTGPHLHFEVRFGDEVRDPQSLLPGISE